MNLCTDLVHGSFPLHHEPKIPRLKDVGSTAARINPLSLTQTLHQPHNLEIQE